LIPWRTEYGVFTPLCLGSALGFKGFTMMCLITRNDDFLESNCSHCAGRPLPVKAGPEAKMYIENSEAT
jgi:hypothetical protein